MGITYKIKSIYIQIFYILFNNNDNKTYKS